MKKEKNNKKKLMAIVGGIAAGAIVAGGGYKIYIESQRTISGELLYGSPIYQAQNQKFEEYFGNEMTSAQVKQILQLINTNNITSKTSKDFRTIGVRFVYGKSKTTIPSDGKSYTTDILSLSNYINPESTYAISVAGKKEYDAVKNGNDGFEYTDDSNTYATTHNTAGYYSTGYIRLIDIVEN